MQSHEVTDYHVGLVFNDFMMHDKMRLYLFVVFEVIAVMQLI